MKSIRINIDTLPLGKVWKELFYSCMENHKEKGDFTVNNTVSYFKVGLMVHILNNNISWVTYDKKVNDTNFRTRIITPVDDMFIEQLAWTKKSMEERSSMSYETLSGPNYQDIYMMLKLMKQAYA